MAEWAVRMGLCVAWALAAAAGFALWASGIDYAFGPLLVLLGLIGLVSVAVGAARAISADGMPQAHLDHESEPE